MVEWLMRGTQAVSLDDPHGWQYSQDALALQHEPCFGTSVYHIIHAPTEALYFGATNHLPNKIFSHWRHRLRSIRHSNLSIAFRAIYTHRRDFLFRLHGITADHAGARDAVNRQKHIWAQTGSHAVLNCTNMMRDRRRWVSIIPRSELKDRLDRPRRGDEPAKVKLDQSKRAVAERVQSTLASGRPATMHNPTDKPAAPMPAFLRHVLGRDDQGDGEA